MTATLPKTPDEQNLVSAPPKSAPAAKRPLNICIASPEFIGLSRYCTTGIAYTALAQALAAAGHHVTCLFLGAYEQSAGPWKHWVEKYQHDRLELIALPQINASELVAPRHLIKSYETYHWLKRNDRFDIIHFPDKKGPGYHTLTAKHHGLAFKRTTICVDLHSLSAWLKAVDQEYTSDSAELDTDFMERRAVALADAVVSPSQYLLNWVSDQQWEMPRHCYVQPGIVPQSGASPDSNEPAAVQEIHELVYFGTLETRRGLALFCDALDRIPAGGVEKIRAVTFLGRESIVDGIPARTYVEKRAQQWSFPFNIITGHDTEKSIDYLRGKNRLAVIPPILENSPYRVLECLVAKVPFVASRVGGIPELIAPEDAEKVCFDPKADALGGLLGSILTGGIRAARPGVDARANEQAWIALYENSFGLPKPVQPSASEAGLTYEAQRAAIQALSIDPANPVALKVLARLHLNAGLTEAAQEACQIALKSNPNDAEALQMIEEAKALGPKSPQAG